MPRDLTRLANMFSVTWPAVKNEVDLGDFIGLETFRLRRPKLYRALRANKDKLCDVVDRFNNPPKASASAEYDRIFLGSLEQPEQDAVRRALKRLFPPLELSGVICITIVILRLNGRASGASAPKHISTLIFVCLSVTKRCRETN